MESTLNHSFDSHEFLKTVAHQPGVYIMRDAAKAILYVGKARNLRKRLTSYFRPVTQLSPKTALLVSKIHDIETLLTNTEKEALLLESSLIKKHKPKYNITLRDDKNYPYIKVSIQEQWPRITMSRRLVRDGGRYFGPYSSSSAMWETIHFLQKQFPLRRCRKGKLKARSRPCLNYQIGQCPAPCVGKADKEC